MAVLPDRRTFVDGNISHFELLLFPDFIDPGRRQQEDLGNSWLDADGRSCYIPIRAHNHGPAFV